VFIIILGYDAIAVIGGAHIAITIYQLWCLLTETRTAVYMCLPTLIVTFINVLSTNVDIHTPYLYFLVLCVVELGYVLYPIILEE